MNQINPNAKPSHFFIGNEKTPIFIIDDALVDTSSVIEEAINSELVSQQELEGTLYPGHRSNIGKDYGMTIIKFITQIFYKFYQVPETLSLIPKDGKYSLLTQSERELSALQCIPHFDSKAKYSFAVLHYLNPGAFGGTGFYRHKPTGFENITEQRSEKYLSVGQKFIDEHGAPEQKFFTYSDDHFELIHKVDYRPNRLVIYPSTILHSGFIENPAHDVNNDPTTGRLSANFFIDFN